MVSSGAQAIPVPTGKITEVCAKCNGGAKWPERVSHSRKGSKKMKFWFVNPPAILCAVLGLGDALGWLFTR